VRGRLHDRAILAALAEAVRGASVSTSTDIECVAAVRSVRMDEDGTPSFFYATASFSSPELSDILCRTTVVSHVFSRGCCSALRPHGLSLA
jgi:hypothetical protein